MPDNLGQGISNPDFLRGQIHENKPGVLTPPKNIIQTVQAAKAVYYQYRTEHLKRIDLYSQIEGLIAGNPPYNPVDLAKNRLSHISNFNNLDARSLYERGALAYWNLLNETEYIAEFQLRSPLDQSAEPPELLEYADIMARHFNDVVRSWPSFYTIVNTLSGQLVKFGISPVLWPDERDWRFRTIELSRFFVEDQAQCDIERLTCICVESIFTAQFLFEVWKQFHDKFPYDPITKTYGINSTWDYEKCPWNLNELSKLLIFKANQFAKTDFQFFDLMDIQRRIQNGDLTFNAIFTDSLRIVSLLYQEYDGKISHYMFDRTYDGGDFLYFADRQYQCMQDGVIIFTASPGEFTIHSNRGLGHKIFSGCQAMMQLDCSIVDAGRMAATPLLKSLATGSKDVEAIRFYPGVPTNIGTAEFVENTIGENLPQLVQTSQYILQKLQYNTANSGDDPGVPDRSTGSISPSQARMQTYKEFGVLKNNIAHFYSIFDLVLRNVVNKMLRSKKVYPGYDYAQEWKDKCIEDGVPEEMFTTGDSSGNFGLPRHMKVKASRVAGDGSTLARIMGLQELQFIASDFDQKAAREYKRQWIMATMGPQYVPAFLPAQEDDSVGQGASTAGTENAIMRLGESPVFSKDNNHRTHIVIHFSLGNDTMQRVQQQQISAVDADKIFVVLLPHLGEHIKAISQSIFTQSFFKSIQKPWGELTKYATLNKHNAQKEMEASIKKQQEQQAQTQQVLSDEQLKNIKAQGDAKRADLKVQSQVDRAKEANQNRAEVMHEKVQSDASNQKLKIQLEAGNKSIQAQQAETANAPLDTLRADLSATDFNEITPQPVKESYGVPKPKRVK